MLERQGRIAWWYEDVVEMDVLMDTKGYEKVLILSNCRFAHP
jgi:hypothetical protein